MRGRLDPLQNARRERDPAPETGVPSHAPPPAYCGCGTFGRKTASRRPRKIVCEAPAVRDYAIMRVHARRDWPPAHMVWRRRLGRMAAPAPAPGKPVSPYEALQAAPTRVFRQPVRSGTPRGHRNTPRRMGSRSKARLAGLTGTTPGAMLRSTVERLRNAASATGVVGMFRVPGDGRA